MSSYDPNDGYERCIKCGELTRDVERICPICRGSERPKRKGRGVGRKPTYFQPGNPTGRNRVHDHA